MYSKNEDIPSNNLVINSGNKKNLLEKSNKYPYDNPKSPYKEHQIDNTYRQYPSSDNLYTPMYNDFEPSYSYSENMFSQKKATQNNNKINTNDFEPSYSYSENMFSQGSNTQNNIPSETPYKNQYGITKSKNNYGQDVYAIPGIDKSFINEQDAINYYNKNQEQLGLYNKEMDYINKKYDLKLADEEKQRNQLISEYNQNRGYYADQVGFDTNIKEYNDISNKLGELSRLNLQEKSRGGQGLTENELYDKVALEFGKTTEDIKDILQGNKFKGMQLSNEGKRILQPGLVRAEEDIQLNQERAKQDIDIKTQRLQEQAEMQIKQMEEQGKQYLQTSAKIGALRGYNGSGYIQGVQNTYDNMRQSISNAQKSYNYNIEDINKEYSRYMEDSNKTLERNSQDYNERLKNYNFKTGLNMSNLQSKYDMSSPEYQQSLKDLMRSYGQISLDAYQQYQNIMTQEYNNIIKAHQSLQDFAEKDQIYRKTEFEIMKMTGKLTSKTFEELKAEGYSIEDINNAMSYGNEYLTNYPLQKGIVMEAKNMTEYKELIKQYNEGLISADEVIQTAYEKGLFEKEIKDKWIESKPINIDGQDYVYKYNQLTNEPERDENGNVKYYKPGMTAYQSGQLSINKDKIKLAIDTLGFKEEKQKQDLEFKINKLISDANNIGEAFKWKNPATGKDETIVLSKNGEMLGTYGISDVDNIKTLLGQANIDYIVGPKTNLSNALAKLNSAKEITETVRPDLIREQTQTQKAVQGKIGAETNAIQLKNEITKATKTYQIEKQQVANEIAKLDRDYKGATIDDRIAIQKNNLFLKQKELEFKDASLLNIKQLYELNKELNPEKIKRLKQEVMDGSVKVIDKSINEYGEAVVLKQVKDLNTGKYSFEMENVSPKEVDAGGVNIEILKPEFRNARNNNPGNIKPGKSIPKRITDNYNNVSLDKDGFVIFNTKEDGYNAMKQLFNSKINKTKSLNGILWSADGNVDEKGNHQRNYDIAKMLGISVNTDLSKIIEGGNIINNKGQNINIDDFMNAIIQKEGSGSYKINKGGGDIDNKIQKAYGIYFGKLTTDSQRLAFLLDEKNKDKIKSIKKDLGRNGYETMMSNLVKGTKQEKAQIANIPNGPNDKLSLQQKAYLIASINSKYNKDLGLTAEEYYPQLQTVRNSYFSGKHKDELEKRYNTYLNAIKLGGGISETDKDLKIGVAVDALMGIRNGNDKAKDLIKLNLKGILAGDTKLNIGEKTEDLKTAIKDLQVFFEEGDTSASGVKKLIGSFITAKGQIADSKKEELQNNLKSLIQIKNKIRGIENMTAESINNEAKEIAGYNEKGLKSALKDIVNAINSDYQSRVEILPIYDELYNNYLDEEQKINYGNYLTYISEQLNTK